MCGRSTTGRGTNTNDVFGNTISSAAHTRNGLVGRIQSVLISYSDVLYGSHSGVTRNRASTFSVCSGRISFSEVAVALVFSFHRIVLALQRYSTATCTQAHFRFFCCLVLRALGMCSVRPLALGNGRNKHIKI